MKKPTSPTIDADKAGTSSPSGVRNRPWRAPRPGGAHGIAYLILNSVPLTKNSCTLPS